MLIDPGTIAGRCEENLNWAKRLDLVSAWATEHDGLRLLEERAEQGLQVRAIVGLWNYITEPKALRRLDRLGKLRLAGGGRRFHPKVYIFRGTNKSVAWIGSANFTCRGFGGNEEVLFETSNTEAVGCWFNQLWEECYPLDESDIHDYEAHRRKNPKQFFFLRAIERESAGRTQELHSVFCRIVTLRQVGLFEPDAIAAADRAAAQHGGINTHVRLVMLGDGTQDAWIPG